MTHHIECHIFALPQHWLVLDYAMSSPAFFSIPCSLLISLSETMGSKCVILYWQMIMHLDILIIQS